MRTALFVVFVSSLALSAGCGKSLSKLTDEQKSAVKDTLTSAGRSVSAAQPGGMSVNAITIHPSATTPNWPIAQAFGLTRIAGFNGPSATPASPPSNSDDQALNSMQSRIHDAASHCNISYPNSSAISGSPSASAGSFGASIPSVTIKVDGDQCPVALDLNFSLTSSQSAVNAKLQCSYAVRDAAYKPLNDVDSMNINGDMNITANGDSGSGKINIQGQIHSQKNGVINTTITGDFSGKSKITQGEIVARFEYPSFTAELKQKVDNGKPQYFINGEEVSEAEFKAYFDKMSMASAAANPSASGVSHPRF